MGPTQPEPSFFSDQPRGCLTMVPFSAKGMLIQTGSSVALRSSIEPSLIWAFAPIILVRLAPQMPIVVVSLAPEADGQGECRLYFPSPAWSFGRLLRYWWRRSRNVTIYLLNQEMALTYRQHVRRQADLSSLGSDPPGNYLVRMVCRPSGGEAIITRPDCSLNVLMGEVADACLACGLAIKVDFLLPEDPPSGRISGRGQPASKVK